MTLPLATTTVTVLRPVDDEDPYGTRSTPATVASGVRAHISSPSGAEQAIGGQQERIDAVLLADPTELRHTDRVVDENLGETYEVTWVRDRVALGLDHTKAGLRIYQGASVG